MPGNLTKAGTKIDYRNRWKTKQEEIGLCRVCAEPLAPNSKNYCPAHLEKALEGNRLRRAVKYRPSKACAVTTGTTLTEFETAPASAREKPFFRR